jgi:mono/diheme cytochrome c family protein
MPSNRRRRGCATALLFASLFASLAIVPGIVRADSADDPALVIITRDHEMTLRRSDLVRRTDLETIQVENDEAYPKQSLRYQAVRLATLLSAVKFEPGDVVGFAARDGYAPRIPSTLVRNAAANQPTAYLAVEDPRNKWPPLHADDAATAGPYYVVWVNPTHASIDPHYWPYQVETITVGKATEDPLILPAPTLARDSAEWLGYRVYAKHCSSCHKLNGSGAAEMGPDLNLPMNPTEYFRDGLLSEFIRDPASVRKYPGSRMSAFPATVISDTELAQLLAYLRHMSGRKPAR